MGVLQRSPTGRAWGNKAINLASIQQLRNRGALGRRLYMDACGQIQFDFFRAAGRVDAPPDPSDVLGVNAVVVLQNRARPNNGSELVLRNTHPLAFKVLWGTNAVFAHINRGVPKRPRQKHRHGNVGAVALSVLDQITRKRQLGDVKVTAAHGSEKHLFGAEQHVNRITAINLYPPVK